MAKTNTTHPQKEEIKTGDTSQIAQQDPLAEDSQAHIKENARKGASIYVPNVIGNDAISDKVVADKDSDAADKAEEKEKVTDKPDKSDKFRK